MATATMERKRGKKKTKSLGDMTSKQARVIVGPRGPLGTAPDASKTDALHAFRVSDWVLSSDGKTLTGWSNSLSRRVVASVKELQTLLSPTAV